MNWREIRLEKSGRKGWDISLPRFEDAEKPEDIGRMNRFYNTAAAEMEKAAALAAETDARRVRYRCETDVFILTEPEEADPEERPVRKKPAPIRLSPMKKTLFPRIGRKNGSGSGRKDRTGKNAGQPGDVRVFLRLSLAVSGQWTREKTLVHLWRDGVLLSSRVLL